MLLVITEFRIPKVKPLSLQHHQQILLALKPAVIDSVFFTALF